MTGPRFVLVTGTDTGVGKTFVGRSLATALTDKGCSVLTVKPVESGCDELDEEEQDGVLLARATGQDRPRRALVRLGEPVAPPVAAEREGRDLNFDSWLEEIRDLGRNREVVLVEGAGGLLSPLTAGHTARDLALELGSEVVVVSRDGLGTLNHTLLTLEALGAVGLRSRAVVLCPPAVADASTGRNASEIARWGSVSVIELPRISVEEAAERLRPLADWLVG